MIDEADAATIRQWHGKRALVIGLGRFGGGVAVARWLVAQGAQVTVTDAAPPESLADSVADLADCPIRLKLGGHDRADLDDTDLVVVNPAVDKRRSVLFREVVRRGIPWTTEINLFCHRFPGTAVGVTGSFGKSTTCAMIAKAIERRSATAARQYAHVFLGGNIGHSLLPELPTMGSDSLAVLELSSAQLDDLPRIGWSPHVAVITNIEPHHLDRYTNFDEYVRAKLHIVGGPAQTRRLFMGDLVPAAERKLRCMLAERPTPSVGVTDPIPPLKLRVRGDHNSQNASMAYAVCRYLGIGDSWVREALATFGGLPHRLEAVRTIDGVDYINDSKCTSLPAMLASVESVDNACILIAGGQDKSQFINGRLASILGERCRLIVVTGETAKTWSRDLAARPTGDSPPPESGGAVVAEDLENAVRTARRAARAGDVVLFAPGAPSFDRYDNFSCRGDHFRSIVMQL